MYQCSKSKHIWLFSFVYLWSYRRFLMRFFVSSVVCVRLLYVLRRSPVMIQFGVRAISVLYRLYCFLANKKLKISIEVLYFICLTYLIDYRILMCDWMYEGRCTAGTKFNVVPFSTWRVAGWLPCKMYPLVDQSDMPMWTAPRFLPLFYWMHIFRDYAELTYGGDWIPFCLWLCSTIIVILSLLGRLICIVLVRYSGRALECRMIVSICLIKNSPPDHCRLGPL